MGELDHISDFSKAAKIVTSDNPNGPIDFSIAQKIEGTTGSTCDVYIVQYHQTKVLIKKLKSNLKDKILYRNALEKEFNLGFRLKHSSLPKYIEFHGDYIIMEYIEGETLADLINRSDSWLSKEKNIRKVLIQLIEVIVYLHSNGISHCDIKGDNIMITKNHHNVVLIDLDKTYTSFNPNSAGSTSHFNVEESQEGHPDMDFHGVGKLVDRIVSAIPGLPVKKYRKFERLCMNHNVDADELLEWLKQTSSINKQKSRKRYLIGDYAFIIIILLILAGVGLVAKFFERDDQKEREYNPMENSPTVITEEPVVEKPLDINIPTNSTPRPMQPKLPDYKKEIESEMKERFIPLEEIISEGTMKLADPDTPDNELRDILFKISNLQSEIVKQAYWDFEEKYPNIDPMDIQMTVIKTSAYKNSSQKVVDILQKITDEIIARNPEIYNK